MNTFSFGFTGLPYISPNYGGKENIAIRRKIRTRLDSIGTIKKLYIDENTKSGRILIELDNSKGVVLKKIISAINNAPLKAIKFSWEQPILNMKSEKAHLDNYKSWLFLEANGSFQLTKEKLHFLIQKEKLAASIELNQYLYKEEFENECELWLLEQNMKELEKTLL